MQYPPPGPHYAPPGPHHAQPGYPPNPHAPYAMPGAGPLYRANVFVPPGVTAGPPVLPGLRKVKLGLGIAYIVALLAACPLFFVGIAMGHDDGGTPFMATGAALFGLFYLLLIGYAILNVLWLHRFWSWIPPEQRYSSMWKKYISPGMAIGFMFIPYFNIYWMFVTYLGIAEIMERLRVQYPVTRGPAKNQALLALIVPMFFFPAGPVLQFMFAKHVEEMATEMNARMTRGMAV